MKRTPKFSPRYGFKKFAEGGSMDTAAPNPNANRPSKDRMAAKERERQERLLREAREAEMDRKMHEAAEKFERERKLRKGGSVKKYARGGGVEVRGKTRGKFV